MYLFVYLVMKQGRCQGKSSKGAKQPQGLQGAPPQAEVQEAEPSEVDAF